MPRPKTKEELSTLSRAHYQTLLDYIESLGDERVHTEFPDGYLNRNVRDVLAHLHHWHLMMKNWYEVGMKGEKPAMPAEGYSWKTVPDLNRKIQQQYHRESLENIRRLLDDSFRDMQQIIDQHTNDELFRKKHYHWTGSTSLGAYLISATSSHYNWAYTLIKKCLRQKEIAQTGQP